MTTEKPTAVRSDEKETSKLNSYNDFLRRFYPESENQSKAKQEREEGQASVFLSHVVR